MANKLNKGELQQIAQLSSSGHSTAAIARKLQRSRGAVTLALARVGPKRRVAKDFSEAIASTLSAPRRMRNAVAWDLERIRKARDDQLLGYFAQPVQLAEAMRSSSAIFVARQNRLAPHLAIDANLIAVKGARGDAVLRRAEQSVSMPRSTLVGIAGTLADHGVAIGYVDNDVNENGTRVDMRVTEWPLEFVRWNTSTQLLETRVASGGNVPIVHGDGRWIVFRKTDVKPWTNGCVLPAALVWASHAESVKDWNATSYTHSLAKLIGTLPEGVHLSEDGETLTEEAQAFLDLLVNVVTGESPAGIAPFGSTTTFASNSSNAWQIFSELVLNQEKAAQRIYQGTDAALGSVGGAPGVDVSALFGVAYTILQSDFEAIEQGLNTGLLIPWTAVNEGDSRHSPKIKFNLPDPDSARKSLEQSEKHNRLYRTLADMRNNQMVINQDTVDRLAFEFGIKSPPVLAAQEEATVPLTFAPTTIPSFVRGREARTSQGLPPFGDARDNMTVREIEFREEARLEQIKNDSSSPTSAPTAQPTGRPNPS